MPTSLSGKDSASLGQILRRQNGPLHVGSRHECEATCIIIHDRFLRGKQTRCTPRRSSQFDPKRKPAGYEDQLPSFLARSTYFLATALPSSTPDWLSI